MAFENCSDDQLAVNSISSSEKWPHFKVLALRCEKENDIIHNLLLAVTQEIPLFLNQSVNNDR